MTTTSTKIVLDLGEGAAAKSGSTATFDGTTLDAIDQCDLTDMATSLGVARKWATFEPDEWLLDGNYHILPETGNHIGIISGEISASNNALDSPQLRIDFDGDYDLVGGITLKFSEPTNDYATDIDVEFYDSGDSLLDSQNYDPDDYEFFCVLPSTPINNVRYVIIYFNFVNRPYRHLRLTDVLLDAIVFQGSEIQNANLIEQIDPVSVELPYNELDFEIFSNSPDFEIINPAPQYAALKEKAKAEAYEVIDGVENYLGRFYLQGWKSITPYRAKFDLADAIWLLEKTPYRGNCWWYPDPNIGGDARIYSQDLLDDLIVDLAGLTYTLDATLENIYMEGVLIDCHNLRDALKEICFAIGAYADCSRSSTIKIVPIVLPEDSSGTDFEFDSTNGQGFEQDLKPLVTGVEVSAIVLTPNSSPPYKVLLDETLAPGTYTFYYQYDGILTDWILTPGADADVNITDSARGQFTIVISGAVSKAVTLETNETYDVNRRLYYEYNTGLPAGTPENIVVIDDAAFVKANKNTTSNGQAVTGRLYDYYANRPMYRVKTFGEFDVVPGAEISVNPPIGEDVIGIIEKVSTNLIGFVSQAEMLVAYVP